jgi:Ca2+-binding EF-hand superfamily protein
LEENHVSLQDFFKSLDANNDGYVSRIEFIKHIKSFLKTQITTAMIDKAMTHMDKDGDEKVTYREFKERLKLFFKGRPHKVKRYR